MLQRIKMNELMNKKRYLYILILDLLIKNRRKKMQISQDV